MPPDHPPSTPIPAPPLNVAGLTCTGTVCGSQVNYVCHKLPPDCFTFAKYELEHLLKPEFWILAALIFYIVSNTYSEDAYQFILGILAKLRPSSFRGPQPRSRVTQIGALVAYLWILWLVWVEGYMVLSTDWRMMRKVFVVWRPSLPPSRLGLFVLYPVWAIICILCTMVVAFTVLFGFFISKIQIQCVTEVALLIIGRRQLDGDQHSPDLSMENNSRGIEDGNSEKKPNKTEATKTLEPLSENSQGLFKN
ncbi:hypothetical protein E0Z10_g5520 [Xylaria hypoxylon]|uniref:Uncharacterized protein n=1 Tax=Xylaria hypoxylon TaxID=37992 RepID=A0A4Z0YIG5_9PEZI|nr:hypothetical protein E0Z10_g5520 [Xylaria hypoxylon]